MLLVPRSRRHAVPCPQAAEEAGEGIVRVSPRSLIALRQEGERLSLSVSRIRSLQSGAYVSPFKGRGMEFDEVRPYQQGDDVRTLDWRVMARTGRPHTKLFREERERAVLLCVDLRRSMFFATRGAYKAVRAAQAAALLGWSAFGHGDRVGGFLHAEEEHEELRPKRGKAAVLHFLQRLGEHRAWQDRRHKTDAAASSIALQQSLARLHRVAQPGSLIFMISDFQHLDELGKSHLTQLARHNDLVLLFVHDAMERELPPPGLYRISDGAETKTIDTANPARRQAYRQRFDERLQVLEELGRRPGIRLLSLSTDEPPLPALQSALNLTRR